MSGWIQAVREPRRVEYGVSQTQSIPHTKRRVNGMLSVHHAAVHVDSFVVFSCMARKNPS